MKKTSLLISAVMALTGIAAAQENSNPPLAGSGAISSQDASGTAALRLIALQSGTSSDAIKTTDQIFTFTTVMDKPVLNKPYAATRVVESVNQLADGNRIVNRTSTVYYRDSQGRTRIEEPAPPQPDGSPSLSPVVLIHDPLAGQTIRLDQDKHTAVVTKTGVVTTARVSGDASGEVLHLTASRMINDMVSGVNVGEDTVAVYSRIQKDPVEKENLGTQVIEGVNATGIRETRTIPAGEIGNELPIKIVTESWYSADLNITVLEKHSDPRTGTLTTRYTNINRADPAAELFTVPPYYAIVPTAAARGGRRGGGE